MDCAPFASLHRENLTADELRSWSALVQQGAERESAGAYAEALKFYFAAAGIDGEYAELAVPHRPLPSRPRETTMSPGNIFCAPAISTRSVFGPIPESMRSIAPWPFHRRAFELVDADAIFAQESQNGIAGSELVYEHVHLTPRGNYLLARAILAQVASQLPARGGHGFQAEGAPSESECERWLGFTRHDRSRVAAEMLRRLEEPPFTNQLNHSEQVLRLAVQASSSEEEPADTAAQYQWAIARQPEDRILHFNYGVFLYPYNPAAAEQQFASARPFDGFPLVTPDGRVH